MGADSLARAASRAAIAPARRRRRDLRAGARLRYAGELIALVAVYYGAAHLGYALQFSGSVAAIVWLPVGVAIAFLYFGGLSLWPGVVAGDLLVNNYSTLPLGTALGQTVGNLLEVLIATILLRRLMRQGPPLSTVGGVTGMAIALAAGTAVSATFGSVSSLLGDVIAPGAWASVWRTWWLGDLSGALLVVPLALAWYRPLDDGLLRRRWPEALATLVLLAGLSAVAIFGQPADHRGTSVGFLLPVVFPALILSAVRLRERGATVAVVLASCATVWATTHFVGPFYAHRFSRSVLETQLFVIVASLTTLCLAAVVSEREALAERLVASRLRVIQAGDAERRRLEHNLHDGAQQLLTGIAVRLGLAAEQVRTSPTEAETLIENAQTDLSVAVDELRALAHGNHPPILLREGLAAALARMAEHQNLDVDLDDLPPVRLDPTVETTAYYVLAEAVANAQKYANASSIRVRAAISSGALLLEVSDDGMGGAEISAGSGLEGLRDRVDALRGGFSVTSATDAGTRVAATIPLSGSRT